MVWDNSYSCLRPKTLAYKVCPCYLGVRALDGLGDVRRGNTVAWKCMTHRLVPFLEPVVNVKTMLAFLRHRRLGCEATGWQKYTPRSRNVRPTSGSVPHRLGQKS